MVIEEKMNNKKEYTIEVAKTTKDPNILTKILKRNRDDYVSWNAAQNPNCPPEALTEVLKRNNNDVVSWCAVQNPKCPPEILAEVLKRNKNDDISYRAVRNPNCPPLARIRWMQNTGQIAKEDPTKHYIEYEEVKPDKDLEELKRLIQ